MNWRVAQHSTASLNWMSWFLTTVASEPISEQLKLTLGVACVVAGKIYHYLAVPISLCI